MKKMKIDELLLLVQAGYNKDEIASMTENEPENESEKKQENESENKSENESEKKQENESEKKPNFDYDKLADTIIKKIQENNRTANLDKNKNSTDDWLSQLSLKF